MRQMFELKLLPFSSPNQIKFPSQDVLVQLPFRWQVLPLLNTYHWRFARASLIRYLLYLTGESLAVITSHLDLYRLQFDELLLQILLSARIPVTLTSLRLPGLSRTKREPTLSGSHCVKPYTLL